MQISHIKNQNFEKPSRNPSNRAKVKILKKNIFWIYLKKIRFPSAQSPRKCSNIEILAKIEGKKAKFFSKINEGQKKSKLSHACVPLSRDLAYFQTAVSKGPLPIRTTAEIARSLIMLTPWIQTVVNNPFKH